MKPLDMDALRENPLEALVVFTDAVKEYAETPGDYDLKCRVLLLGGFLAGMAMRDKQDWERSRWRWPNGAKRPGPRG